MPIRRAACGELQRILNQAASWRVAPATERVPQFHLRPVEEIAPHLRPDTGDVPSYADQYSWICDGPQKIGLINRWTFEIEMFRFRPPADNRIVEYTMPAMHHWATLQGPRIVLRAPTWRRTSRIDLSIVCDRGPMIVLRVAEQENAGSGAQQFTLAWDDRLGYVWTVDAHYALRQPAEFEFNNLLAGGLAESRDDRKRWQKTVWTRPDGTIGCLFHNPLSPFLPHTPEWRNIAPGGFVGFIAEDDSNPFLSFESFDPQLFMLTCSEWYDQHILARPAPQAEADGFFHVRARFRLLSLPGATVREIERLPLVVIPDSGAAVLGFRVGLVNDFESVIPSNEVYNGPAWLCPPASDQAHSGRHSLKIVGAGTGRVQTLSPIRSGPPIYGESARRYRFSAWIRTAGVQDGGAFLQVDDVFWNWKDVRATRRSQALVGDSDWQEVALDFQPSKGDPLLLIKLCIEGTGTAWFDDLSLIVKETEEKGSCA